MTRTITTLEELQALTDDALVEASGSYLVGGTFERCWLRPLPRSITGTDGRLFWEALGYGVGGAQAVVRSEDIRLPATVLYDPSAPAPNTGDREALTIGAGRIVGGMFSDGGSTRCDCEDAHVYPEGTYIEVRLDNPDAAIGPRRVLVTEETARADDRRVTITDEMVEAGAKALFEESQELDQDNSWSDPLPDDWRAAWIYQARAVLEAALGEVGR